MYKKFFTSIIVLLMGILIFPQYSFATAQFQSFSATLAFGNNCTNPKVTYSTTITPSSITTGNTFKIGVRLQNASGTGQDFTETQYPVTIPSNGNVTNGVINLTQTIVPTGSYIITLYEFQGTNLVHSAAPSTVSPSNTAGCAGQGTAAGNTPAGSAPGGVSAVSFDVDIQNPISVNSIPDLIETVLEAMIKIGIPLLVVMIVFSGFMYLLARGDPGKLSKAHTMFLYTLIGGAILLAAWALAQLILTTLIEITASVDVFLV